MTEPLDSWRLLVAWFLDPGYESLYRMRVCLHNYRQAAGGGWSGEISCAIWNRRQAVCRAHVPDDMTLIFTVAII